MFRAVFCGGGLNSESLVTATPAFNDIPTEELSTKVTQMYNELSRRQMVERTTKEKKLLEHATEVYTVDDLKETWLLSLNEYGRTADIVIKGIRSPTLVIVGLNKQSQLLTMKFFLLELFKTSSLNF